MLNTVKKVARWAGPGVALLAFYMAVWDVPSLPVAVLLVGAGLFLSWGTPWVAKKVMGLVS